MRNLHTLLVSKLLGPRTIGFYFGSNLIARHHLILRGPDPRASQA
jgi:hypothetical protein